MSGLNDGSMDMPYESQDETPLTDHFVVCGGVVTMAASIDVDGTHQPALVFRFATADGGGFLAPVLLCVDDRQMRDLGTQVRLAVRDSRRAARAKNEEAP